MPPGGGSGSSRGEAAALLFAFAILAALTLRRDLAAARRRLAWYGARGWQLALLTVAESGLLALAGTALGFGSRRRCGGAVVAERAGAPVGGGARAERPLRPRGSRSPSLVAAVAPRRPRRRRRGQAAAARRRRASRSLDAAAVAAIALVVVELDARRRRTATSSLLLPALVTFAAAVARRAPAARRRCGSSERLARGRSLGLRLASLSLARNPGYAIVATAFLVVSFGLALFAESYRATLARGERDQAAHRVPLDFVVREDLRRLIPVLDAASLERFRALPAVEVAPVLRLRGGVGRLEGESGITLLGLPPASLPQLHGWREDERGRDRRRSWRADRGAAVAQRAAAAARPDRLSVQRGGEAPCASSPSSRAERALRPRLELGDGLRRFRPRRAAGGSPGSRSSRRRACRSAARTRATRLAGVVRLSFPDLPQALDGWVGVGGAQARREHRPLHAHERGRDADPAAPAGRPRAGPRARDAAARRRGGRGRPAAAADRRRAARRCASSGRFAACRASTGRRSSATRRRSAPRSISSGRARRA